jgi:hypothetical protein
MYGYVYLPDSGAPKGGHDTVKRRVSFLCALLPFLALLGCGNNSQAHPFVSGRTPTLSRGTASPI